jgi:DNA-binding protein Fis
MPEQHRTKFGESVKPTPLDGYAQRILDIVPPLADLLVASRPGHVYREVLAVFERSLLVHILRLTGGNQLRAARLLGVDRATLYKRCREFGLRSSDFRADPRQTNRLT